MLIKKYINVGGKILDIGCGAGRLSFALCKMGYNVIAIDVSNNMIKAATAISCHECESCVRPIFIRKDVCDFIYPRSVDAAIFSYNGLMGLKGAGTRHIALCRIFDCLVKGGIFIFTTHIDYLIDNQFSDFWAAKHFEYTSKQLPINDSFSDIIVEEKGAQVFQHFSTDNEISAMISQAGFALLETKLRSEIANEKPITKQQTRDCRFWVCMRP